MRRILPILFKKIGYQEIPDENDLTKCLRQEIAKWACVLGDSDCRIIATSRLEWHFTNPEKHKYIYCLICFSLNRKILKFSQ